MDNDLPPTAPLHEAIATSPSPLDRLRNCAALYAEAHGAKPSRLSRLAINDAGFFDNLDARPKGPSIDTMTTFARFLADAGNWPEGGVPQEAREFAHVMGVSASAGSPSPGTPGENSPEAKQRDAA